jgi:predicted DNA-binding protein (UPF0251 family)
MPIMGREGELDVPRPTCCRRVARSPRCGLFKPAGVACSSLSEVVVTVDEMEAIRLADLDGMYQEQAAERMNVSRQTFGRIIESARRKVAQALTQGQALRIEGGTVEVVTMRRFQCYECQNVWELPHGTGRPQACPKCSSTNIHRAAEDRGWACGAGRDGGHGHGRCRRRGSAGVMRQNIAPAGREQSANGQQQGESI